MEVNGHLSIEGNLTMSGTVTQKGKACILVEGTVTDNCTLLTANADGTPANSFPNTAVLGIMSTGNMMIGSTSQLKTMGAFYSQTQIAITKQTDIAGTIVSNYFDMGKNVPAIYQVPNLPQNLPIGMIGMVPILVVSPVSWRELSPT
jgi:hypothetical protein